MIILDRTARKQAAKKLNEAVDYLDKYGWQQGSLGFDGGPRCAFGALVSVGWDEEPKVKKHIKAALELVVPDVGSAWFSNVYPVGIKTLVAYNDNVDDVDQVKARLAEAAKVVSK